MMNGKTPFGRRPSIDGLGLKNPPVKVGTVSSPLMPRPIVLPAPSKFGRVLSCAPAELPPAALPFARLLSAPTTARDVAVAVASPGKSRVVLALKGKMGAVRLKA